MDLVLHIGRHKTGTTAIQRHMQAVTVPGVCYPLAGRTRPGDRPAVGHHPLARLLQSGTAGSRVELEALASDIRSEAEGSDTIVLSSEIFSLLDGDAVERTRWFFGRAGVANVRIIAYLRESLSFVTSLFQQEVQSGRHHYSLPLYLARHVEFDVAGARSRWEPLGRLTLRPYDRAMLTDGDVVSDFVEMAGLPIARPSSPRRDPNPSVAGNLLAIKAALNSVGSGALASPKALRTLANAEPRFRGRFRIPPSVAQGFRSASSLNKELLRLFPDLALPDLATAPPVPDLASFPADLGSIADSLSLPTELVRAIDARRDEARTWFFADHD